MRMDIFVTVCTSGEKNFGKRIIDREKSGIKLKSGIKQLARIKQKAWVFRHRGYVSAYMPLQGKIYLFLRRRYQSS